MFNNNAKYGQDEENKKFKMPLLLQNFVKIPEIFKESNLVNKMEHIITHIFKGISFKNTFNFFIDY